MGCLEMINKVSLTVQDIYEKEFKKSMRGYNEEEVDEFLDIVISDYEKFIKEIDRLKKEIKFLKQENEDTDTNITFKQQPQVNYDVLKRLSNLEKAVFGQRAIENDQ